MPPSSFLFSCRVPGSVVVVVVVVVVLGEARRTDGESQLCIG